MRIVVAPISALQLKLEAAMRARSAEYYTRVNAELAQRWKRQRQVSDSDKQTPVAPQDGMC